MMYPPVFSIAVADPDVLAALGTSPTRLWPFGHVPQGEVRPYAVHQLVYGSPENSLSCVPSEDNFGIQFDAYAKTVTDARNVAAALRDAYEATYNHVVSWNGEFWDQPTGLYRVSFTVEFWTEREQTIPTVYTLILSGDEITNPLILSGDEQDSGTDQLVI